MDESRPVLGPEERDALRPQRPPERFAERVMGAIAAQQRARRRRWQGAAVTVAMAGALAASWLAMRPGNAVPLQGEITATTRTDVHVGPHVVAVLERGAHIAWSGDDVTQLAGDVFYRVERGGPRHVRTPSGDVTVHGTCFDVKVRGGTGGTEGEPMTRRDAVAGAVGALASAAVFVGVYEGRVTLSRASASVEVSSGQGARIDGGGIHGPQEMAAAERGLEGSSPSDPLLAANANLTDQVRAYQRRLDESQRESERISKELGALKLKLAELEPDSSAAADPFNPTPEQWKELAKENVVRAKNFCFPPPDWQPTPDQLADLGLAPGDGPTLTKALADGNGRMWQVVGPACAKIVGSMDVAQRLGNETCGTIIQRSESEAQFEADTQLVADIRAGNKPMPPAGQLDAVASRLLAMTNAAGQVEKDLASVFGPEEAKRLAYGDSPWACALQFGQPAGNDPLRSLGQGSQ
jgi:hypothetical protein